MRQSGDNEIAGAYREKKCGVGGCAGRKAPLIFKLRARQRWEDTSKPLLAYHRRKNSLLPLLKLYMKIYFVLYTQLSAA